ncbi:hypothetical protein [Pontibacter chinhatensis]|uniref:hypothetical protein n=1 Tax=Pontibacter chinhatensis TaxID=1436961 RepID=UPI001587AB93|nr:hypothetical protein [Pontibacter chinhatensis]
MDFKVCVSHTLYFGYTSILADLYLDYTFLAAASRNQNQAIFTGYRSSSRLT